MSLYHVDIDIDFNIDPKFLLGSTGNSDTSESLKLNSNWVELLSRTLANNS